MNGINPAEVGFVLSKIEDGFVFERFAQEIISHVVGHTFVPVGGIHDKGIDGLEHTFSVEGRQTTIYQLSIEKDVRGKIDRTINTLKRNEVEFQQLVYVSNREANDIYKLGDDFYKKYDVYVEIRDIDWFKNNINRTEGSRQAFIRFRKNYLYEYEQPGKAYELLAVYEDPRIYVFLRQQVDEREESVELDTILADTLILYALEGTDPNKNIFRTRDEIVAGISELTPISTKWLHGMIDKRLKVLSSKPDRKIRHHKKEDLYCLPYETRLEISEKNVVDIALHEEFCDTTKRQLEELFKSKELDTDESYALLEKVFHRLFSQQGLEFAQFLDSAESTQSIEKSLVEIVSDVIYDSRVKPLLRETIAPIIVSVIRKIVYSGSNAQLEFIRRLADTYRLLFLLQCDPEVMRYFTVMASKLRIYVDNSIIIPAISEYFLEERHRRHWNLLTSAREAGVKLIVSEMVISELASHLRGVRQEYERYYRYDDNLYEDDAEIYYIDQILIRAYFYAKMSGAVEDFEEFYRVFVPMGQPDEDDLIMWLEEAFDIEYQKTSDLNVEVDEEDERVLYEELKKLKPTNQQAKTDAKQLLTIYALRQSDNELKTEGLLGYRTWWLTTDTKSQQAWQTALGQKSRFKTSPYIRSDFLYNYISLAPSKTDVDKTYQKVFPTLLGVNISYHVPDELKEVIQDFIREHRKMAETPGFRSVLKNLSNRLKSEPTKWTKERVVLWLDEQRNELAGKTS